jgi:hypothetical protein
MMTLLGVSAERVLRRGDAASILGLVAVFLILGGLGYALQRWFGVEDGPPR